MRVSTAAQKPSSFINKHSTSNWAPQMFHTINAWSLSERNIPSRIMVAREKWKTFTFYHARQTAWIILLDEKLEFFRAKLSRFSPFDVKWNSFQYNYLISCVARDQVRREQIIITCEQPLRPRMLTQWRFFVFSIPRALCFSVTENGFNGISCRSPWEMGEGKKSFYQAKHLR